MKENQGRKWSFLSPEGLKKSVGKMPQEVFLEALGHFQFLHVSELRSLAEACHLSKKGGKRFLIERILHFLKTGEKQELPSYPAVSLAKGSLEEPITAKSQMLRGRYKNDLKNRLFFKKLIGPHFHFTAFGIDWLEDRWLKGQPPTYQEYAEMWTQEMAFRKTKGSLPKDEWAYIRFVKNYLLKDAKAGRSDLLKNWEEERILHKKWIDSFLNQCMTF